MQEAVKKGKAQPEALALLEDRVLTNQGKEQIYGSQIKPNENGKYEFYPIKDETNVNNRRASLGLNYWKNLQTVLTSISFTKIEKQNKLKMVCSQHGVWRYGGFTNIS